LRRPFPFVRGRRQVDVFPPAQPRIFVEALGLTRYYVIAWFPRELLPAINHVLNITPLYLDDHQTFEC